jgi:hypothetical protein
VNVTTTSAAVDDSTQIESVHEGMARRALAPGEHLVEGGYTCAAIILAARAQGIDLIGPLPPASDRQTREGKGFALTDFTIDWTRSPRPARAGRRVATGAPPAWTGARASW